MSRLFKGLALLVGVACFVWVGVLWHWQATQRDMSVQDIGVYLVALPLTVFTLLLLGRWAWVDAAARAAGTSNGAPPPAAPAEGAAPPAFDEAERRLTVRLLTAQLNCAAGTSPAEVLGALREGQPRPGLDPELRDDEGLPLLTARVRDLDVAALELDEPAVALRQRHPAWQHESARPEVRRALAALQPALRAALDDLRPWRARLGLDDAPVPNSGASVLRVLPVWPTDWRPFEVALASAWLEGQLLRADVVRPDRLAWLPGPAAGQAWAEAERLMRLLERDGRADLLLVVASHSALGDSSMRRLLGERALYTAATPRQPIAGEAAAALVLAPTAWPVAADVPAWVLHRAAMARRDRSVDSGGRTSTVAVGACIEQAVAAGPFQTGAISAVVHDADQHTARAAEALAALLQTQPHLDAAEDVHGSGALNGQTGVVAPLITVALAAQVAAQLERPCLALSVDDAHWRFALVARPATFDPAAPPA